MSSVEAAANLFGSDDANSDPFASLGNEPDPQDDFFASNIAEFDQSSAAPDAGQGGSVASQSAPSNDGGHGAAYASQPQYGAQGGYGSAAGYEQQSSEAGAYNYGSSQPAYGSPSVISQSQSAYDPYGASQQQGYSQPGAHSGYDANHVHPTANAYGSYAQPATSQYAPPAPAGGASTYSPYAPQNASLPQTSYAPQQATPAYNAYAPPAPTTTYSPYAPQTATVQSPYAPANAGQNANLNAYAPSTSSYYGTTSTPGAAESSYNTPAPPPIASQPLGGVPPPPKPVAPLNRPKANAYDPPFPTGSSRRPQRVVTPYEQPMYGSQAQAAPLPPPPPRSPYASPVQRFATSPPQGHSNSPPNSSAQPARQASFSSLAQSAQPAGVVSPPPLHNAPPPPRQPLDTTNSYDGHQQYSPVVQNKVPAYSHSRPNSRQGYERYTPSPLSTSRVISPPQHPEASAPAVVSPSYEAEPESESVPAPVSTDSTSVPEGDFFESLASDDSPALGSPDTTITAIDRVLSPVHQTTAALTQSDSNGAHRPYSPSGRYTPHSLSRISSPVGSVEQDTTPIPANSVINNEYASPPSRVLSPALSVKSNTSQSAYKPSTSYAPMTAARNRSTSNSSVVSNQSTSSVNGPYGTTHRQPRRQPSELSDYGDYTSHFNYPQAPPPGQSPYAPSYTPSAPASQPPAGSPYAPSVPQSSSGSPYAPPAAASSSPYAPSTGGSDPYAPTAYGQGATDPHAASSAYSPPKPSTLHNRSFSGTVNTAIDPSTYSMPQRASYDQGPSQELTVPSVISSQYAPSPSLIGSNDPLGRTSARIPVFSFGFGGKCVTCFHGASNLETGFDVALTSRLSTAIEIKQFSKFVPESALSSTAAEFPGPLFMDPGASTSLVRTGLSTQASVTKAKKAKVIKYLSEREEELAVAIPYLHAGSVEHGKAEGKLTLVKLLTVMVEHDGVLGGSAAIDTAVRGVLVPSIKGEEADESNGTFTSVADMQGINGDLGYSGAFGSTEEAMSTTTLRSSALEKIQGFLLRGERRKAYHYALDQKLWAHAMVISSSIDKEAWQEAVTEFLRTELGPKDDGALTSAGEAARVNGWEGLRVAYSLFSGTGAGAVQELVPQKLLSKAIANGLQIPLMSTTPGTPNFPSKATSASIPAETLSKWTDTAAMILSNPLGPEAAAALTSLGDHLSANGWTEAAHTCYLLSPQSSPVGGVSNPAARLVLAGASHPTSNAAFHLDQDAIILTEIVEYAMSLNTTKGHEAFPGLPHLQPYRLLRALSLAETGHIAEAKRYCEAISTSLTRSSPYFTPAFLEQLKSLLDRITAAPQLEKGGSWIPGKVAKPSLDTIGGWLEGRITKLIAGDGETYNNEAGEETARPDKQLDGPFAHYSTISSNAPSTSPSPAPSFSEQQPSNTIPPQRRSGSTSTYNPMLTPMAPPSGRSSSAMDFTARRSSPGPRIASAGPGTTSFSQSASFSQAMEHMHHSHQNNSIQESYTNKDSRDDVGDDDGTAQEVTWWGQNNYGDNYATPTATTFMKVDNAGGASSDSDGFISLMDSTPSFTPSPSHMSRTASHADEDEVEDLGFGNSNQKGKEKDNAAASAAKSDKAAPPPRPDAKPVVGGANNSSWFGRWWKKEGGPVRANLGEETSMYFDPELKKWVNRNASAEPAKSLAPPPPSRVHTASPSAGGPPGTNGPPSARSTPPPRATSAVDLGSSPPTNKSVMRIRSNLVPSTDSAPSTPTGMHTSLPPPPASGPDRPRSQASKRNIRSRYVDVFQDGK
ncbi:Sec23-binding domain of Sec16-domain-containing protein [Pterulicium gracile]|uniref:Protein transport protein sec16 n=1 Tax=Pterulicium gracile TaxID=1884261 RepID=A0A5C3R079_9AGAR|nr:Sec23-binding domain of Sec16-domain-containing protein [Pterula gracilis]